MNYHVVFSTEAEQSLLEALSSSSNQSEIIAKARWIIETLSVDPGEVGESRDEGERVVIKRPLAILFRVNPATFTVTILMVHCYT